LKKGKSGKMGKEVETDIMKEPAGLHLIIEDDANRFDPMAVPTPDMFADIRDRPESRKPFSNESEPPSISGGSLVIIR
jgi:hypothetical protein